MINDSVILILGATGQIGSNLVYICKKQNITYLTLNIDFTDKVLLLSHLQQLAVKPNIIINAAAYTAVDQAEDENAKCYAVNTEAVEIIANFCKSVQAIMIHYSSDYVYDGQGNKPFHEDEANINPLNIYGKSKYEADKIIANICPNYLIFRTSWVYNHAGKNFLLTMLKLFREKETLKIVNDQIGSPTYAYDIADYSLRILDINLKNDSFISGIYHMVNKGFISWYQFAELIKQKTENENQSLKIKNLIAVTSEEFPTKAKRPHNSRLSSDKLKQIFNLELPDIEDALDRSIAAIKKTSAGF